MRALLVLALLIPTAARADDDWTALDVTPLPHGATPCDDRPTGCHRVATAPTKAGPVELYAATDARTTAGNPRRGEYLAMYVLALPGRATTMFEEGTHPNAHHYELCGAASDWCGRIVSSTPRLTVDRKGTVTVVVKTITLDQRWADPDHVARGTVRERHAHVRTVTCVDTEDGWGCSASP